MLSSHRLIALSLGALAAFGAPDAAAQPRVSNGKVTSQAAGAPLAPAFRALVTSQPDVTWLGYSVPVVAGERVMCCGDFNNSFAMAQRQARAGSSWNDLRHHDVGRDLGRLWAGEARRRRAADDPVPGSTTRGRADPRVLRGL